MADSDKLSIDLSFRVMIENMSTGAITLDNNGIIIFANQAFLNLCGQETGAITHTLFINYLPVSQHDDFFAFIQECIVSPISKEFSINTKSGYTTPVSLFITIFEVSGNKHICLLVTDLTERNDTERTLRGILDATKESIWMFSTDGTILLGNPIALNRLQKTAHEVIGKHFEEFMPKDVGRSRRKYLQKVVATGNACEFDDVRNDNYFFHSFYPIKDNTGRVTSVVSFSRDITKRKKREEELYTLNRTLTALSHSSQMMIRTRDDVEYLNKVCKIIVEDCRHAMVWIGYAEDDENKTVRPIAWAGFEAGYLDSLHLTWADTERGQGPTGTAIRTGTISLCRNMQTDPKFRPWRVEAIKRGYNSSVVIPLMHEGKAFGAITIYSEKTDPFTENETRLLSELADDLSYGIQSIRLRNALMEKDEELQQHAKQLEIVNKDLESFSYSISHDLRSHLFTIRCFGELLLNNNLNTLDSPNPDYLKHIINSSDKMNELIDNMLRLSKISRQKINHEEIDLSSIAASIINELYQTEPTRTIRVEIAQNIKTTGDPHLVKIALSNLFGNAWKYTSKTPDARIEFGAIEKDCQNIFFLRDNGAGFNMKFAEKIFEPFVRMHSESEFPGTGIGLAIVKKVIEKHYGTIWCESKPGEGTTFYFELPKPTNDI